jgi:hypothetical protein
MNERFNPEQTEMMENKTTPEEWEKSRIYIDGLKDQLREKAKSALGDKAALWKLKKNLEAAEMFKEVYGQDEYLKYRAYHQLIGSTPRLDQSPFADFPREPKVETVYKNWLQELDNPEKCLAEMD